MDLDQSRHLEEEMIPLHVLSSGHYICCMAGTNSVDVATNSDLANEQCFLEEMLAVQNSVLKPLGRKSSQDDIFSNLSSRYLISYFYNYKNMFGKTLLYLLVIILYVLLLIILLVTISWIDNIQLYWSGFRRVKFL